MNMSYPTGKSRLHERGYRVRDALWLAGEPESLTSVSPSAQLHEAAQIDTACCSQENG